MSGNENRKVSSLRDLPREIAPPRDLWKGIEAQIAPGVQAAAPAPRRSYGLRVFAAAAVIVALAGGVWIGRAVLPVPGAAVQAPQSAIVRCRWATSRSTGSPRSRPEISTSRRSR